MPVKRVKQVLMQGRSSRIHYAVDCTPDGVFSYVLCRGFPSVGKHDAIHPEIDTEDALKCAQCQRVFDKMLRQRPEAYKVD